MFLLFSHLWPIKFCWKSYWVALYITSCFSLAVFKILYLSLTFNILILLCICGSRWASLIETLWDPWIQMSVFFPRLQKFIVIMFFQINLKKLSYYSSTIVSIFPHHFCPTLDPTPFGLVHVSFIYAPWQPFPNFPLSPPLVTVSLFFISMPLVIFCLLVCFVD